MLHDCKQQHYVFTLRESVLIDKVVFFFVDDNEPHLLFLEACCPSEVGVLDNDVPLSKYNTFKQNNNFSIHHSRLKMTR